MMITPITAKHRLSWLRCLHVTALALVAIVGAISLAPPAVAQTPTASDVDAEAMARAAAQRQLTGALARIAADGGDGQALSEAGRSALALGDARAAIGFLVRAEALMPRDPVIKAALGGAMVQLEDPTQAMRYFDAAIAAGGLDRTYMADRALAYDLLGDQRRAQADYAVAQASAPSAELTRRWAVSLGISGQSDQAVRMLAPLLRAQDRAAWRSRAMIVAMNGRAEEARQIARTTLPPELASALDPYFALMDRLTPAQLASASHFGRFPAYDQIAAQPSRSEAVRLAAAATAPPPVVAAPTGRARDRSRNSSREDRRTGSRSRSRTTVAAAAPPPVPTAARAQQDDLGTPPPPPPVSQRPAQVAVATVSAPIVQALPAAASPPPSAPAAVAARIPVQAPPQSATAVAATSVGSNPVAGPPNLEDDRPAATVMVSSPAVVAPPTAATTTPPPAAAGTVLPAWSLADVVQSVEVPAAELAASADALSLADIQRIAEERRQAQATAAESRARAAEEARTRARAEAETRRRAEAEAARAEQQRLRQQPARIWVQIATGGSVSGLSGDYGRLSRRYAQQFQGQRGSTSPWNRMTRLVVGPFPTMAAARAWDSAYRAAGGQSFIWNSDVGEEVTPLPRR